MPPLAPPPGGHPPHPPARGASRPPVQPPAVQSQDLHTILPKDRGLGALDCGRGVVSLLPEGVPDGGRYAAWSGSERNCLTQWAGTYLYLQIYKGLIGHCVPRHWA
jgi:hypothetical protein